MAPRTTKTPQTRTEKITASYTAAVRSLIAAHQDEFDRSRLKWLKENGVTDWKPRSAEQAAKRAEKVRQLLADDPDLLHQLAAEAGLIEQDVDEPDDDARHRGAAQEQEQVTGPEGTPLADG